MANLIHALAADTFVDLQDLTLDAGLGYTSTFNDNVNSITSSSAALNRKFFPIGTSNNNKLRLALNIDDFEIADDNSRSMEIHFLLRFGSGVTVNSGHIFFLLQPVAGISSSSVIIRTTLAQDGLSNRAQEVLAGGTRVPTDNANNSISYIFEPSAFAYGVVRIKSETSAGADDGALEYWINGNLVASRVDYNWQHNDFNWENSGKVGLLEFAGIGGTFLSMTNLAIYDGWTTDAGTRPGFIEVQDVEVDAISGSDYRNNVGSALTAGDVNRINDNTSSTFIQSDVAGAELTLTLSTLQSLEPDLEFTAMQFRGRMSRANLDDNVITVELVERATGTVVSTFDKSLLQVTSVRERINQFFEVNGTLLLSDYDIVIRNGI